MRKLLPQVFILFFFTGLRAQYVRVGNSSFAGTIAGPFAVSTSLSSYTTRFAYIFPRSVLGNIQHGDTITSLEFARISGNTLNSNCNLTIYARNTSKNDFGTAKLYWPTEISGATRVYDQNPSAEITGTEGFQKIPFYNKVFAYDTTKGNNFELLVEYKQTATQTATVFWYFEDASSITGYSSNQMKSVTGTTTNDSLGSGSDRHPTIILNFPKYDNDVAVIKVYTLGKLPVPLGNPDSVQALVRNVGKKSQSSVRLISWIKGPNKNQLDSGTFSIAVGEQKYVNVPSLKPSRKGLDTVFVQIVSDANHTNDTGFSFRFCNENIYSYRDVTQPPDPGGIGFNGSTGDFVARFFANKTKNINQVTVNFAITGRPFKIGIWESKANREPGKLIYISDSLNTVAGNYILDLKKPVQVNGSFFVGVRQLNTNNVAFGYQTEDPVRPKTFYYAAPMGDTTWADFYPDAPFKFLIEPRLQGDTDLTVLSADYPKDSIDMYTTDTIAPKCTVGNIGLKDLKDSFSITCEILVFGKRIYKEVLHDTMSSGQKRSYTFPKTFFPTNYGEHEVVFYTSVVHDQITDNDTARRKFYVGVKKDVIVQTVYDPPNGTIYEYLRDTLMPVAAVQNVGYDNTVSFTARCVIKKGSTVFYNKIQTLQLPKFQSKILNWPTYKCLDTGKLEVLFITEMAGDKNRKNDTARRTIYIFKSYDVGIDSVKVPDKNVFYSPGKGIKPSVKIYNDGLLNLYNAKLSYRVSSQYTSAIWVDTLTVNMQGKEHVWLNFSKAFTPTRKGVYTIMVHIYYSGDLVNSNDSVKFNFNVGNPYDYSGISVIYPVTTDTLDVGAGPFAPKMRVKNNGFVKNTDIVPVVFQIWKNNLMVYQNIKNTTVDTGQSSDITFAQTFNPQNSGKYSIIAYTNYASDVFRANDTATSWFTVKIGRDAYVKSIDTPFITDTYSAKVSNIKIRGTIANYGKLALNPVRFYAEIFHGNTQLYYHFIDDSLKGFENKTLTLSVPFVPMDSGMYKLLLRTFSLSDQNIFNDTLIGYFFVSKGKDLKAIQWINPLNGSVVVNTAGPSNPAVYIKNVGMDTTPVNGYVTMYFFDSANGNIVFSDTESFIALKQGIADTLHSKKTWDFSQLGTYNTLAIVNAGDAYPENDTLRSTFHVVLNNTTSLSRNVLKIFPNPTTGYITILSQTKVTNIALLDIAGRQIKTFSPDNKPIDISFLSSGTYLFYIQTTAGSVCAKVYKQ